MKSKILLSILVLVSGLTSNGVGQEKGPYKVPIPEPMQVSGDVEEIDLIQAIYLSLDRNPLVELNRLDIDRREGQLQTASGEFDWYAVGSGEFQRKKSPSISLLGNVDTLVEETIDYTLGVTRKMRSGISVAASASASLTKTVENPNGVNDLTQAGSLLNLELLIPLLRGLGESSTGAVENSLKKDLEAARFAYLQALSDQTLSTLVAYWRCASARVRVNVLSDIELRAEDLINKTQAMVDAELLSSAVLPQARANLNDQRSQYLSALADLSDARYQLGQSLGLAPAEMVNIPLPEINIPELEADRDYQLAQRPGEFIQLAIEERADLRSARESLAARGILVDAALKDLKPQLDLRVFSGYIGGGVENKPFRVLEENLKGPYVGVALDFELPWHNDFREGQLLQRRSEYERAEYLIFQLQQEIASSTLKAAELVSLNASRALLAQDTVRQYKEAVDVASQRLAAGDASVFEVIDMEGRYARSLLERVNALRDYYISVGRLRYESGTFFKQLNSSESFELNPLDSFDLLQN